MCNVNTKQYYGAKRAFRDGHKHLFKLLTVLQLQPKCGNHVYPGVSTIHIRNT